MNTNTGEDYQHDDKEPPPPPDPTGTNPPPDPAPLPPIPPPPPTGTTPPPDPNADGSQALDNTPLALPGSYANPGTKGAVPFHTPSFMDSRFVGAGNAGPQRFGAGSPLTGGGDDALGGGQQNDLVKRIMAGLFGQAR